MKNTAGGSMRRTLKCFVPEPLTSQRDTAGRLGGGETGPSMFCLRSEKHCWGGEGLGRDETGPNMFCPEPPVCILLHMMQSTLQNV